MILCKSRNGITLLEALIALAMISITSTMFFSTQMRSMSVGVQAVRQLIVMLAAEQWFTEMEQRPGSQQAEKPRPLVFPAPPGTMTFSSKKIDKNSSLKAITGLRSEMITATWQDRGRPMTLRLMRIVYDREMPHAKERI